jgi:phage FluMu gp28-like protein
MPLIAETEIARARLQQALPRREWLAASAWLSTLYPYQQNWLLDWQRFALLNKSRQIGASHTYAGAATLWAILGETTTVISVGEREAVEVLDKASKHAQALAMLGSEWARPVGMSATTLRLKSGGRVIALPSTSGGRSFSGNVLLDEFAYHQHPEKVWDGAGGTVMHGYKLRVMSTPNGVGNLWHQLWTDPKAHAGYSLHEVTLEQAMADGLIVSLEDCWKMARGDPRVFDQLFRCKFLDNNLQYIATDLLNLIIVDDVGAADGENYAGLDIGMNRDLTCLAIVNRSGDMRRLVHIETHKRTDDETLDALCEKAFGVYKCRRLSADATGMGSIPSTRWRRKYGSRFEPYVFTNKSKEELATGLYAVAAADELRIPKNYMFGGVNEAALLRDDVSAIRRIVTTAGNVRYDAPRTEAGHADRAWALMLALNGCAKQSRMFGALMKAAGKS